MNNIYIPINIINIIVSHKLCLFIIYFFSKNIFATIIPNIKSNILYIGDEYRFNSVIPIILILFKIYCITKIKTTIFVSLFLDIFFTILIQGIARIYKINITDKNYDNPLNINVSFLKKLCISNRLKITLFINCKGLNFDTQSHLIIILNKKVNI